MRNALGFNLMQGHQERVRNAAVRWSPNFAYALNEPTLYPGPFLNKRWFTLKGAGASALWSGVAGLCTTNHIILHSSKFILCSVVCGLFTWPGAREKATENRYF